MSDLSKTQKGIMITLYILTALSLLLSCFTIYNLAVRSRPWTMGVAYASALTKTEDQVPICTVKIHDNTNKNGQTLYEVQFNSYTDHEGGSVSGFGMQCTGDWELFNGLKSFDYFNIKRLIELNEKYNNSKQMFYTTALGDFYLYYMGDDKSSYMLPDNNIKDYLLIDIQGTIYKLTLKNYTFNRVKDSKWAQFKNSLNDEWGREEVKTQYSWYEVFDYIIKSALTSSARETNSVFPLSLLDLDPYMKIEKQDSKGRFDEVPKTTETRNYLTIQVEYTKDGATKATDSKFNQVGYSTTWSYNNQKEVKDYWNAYTTINLTEKHLSKISSSHYTDSYYLTIDKNFVDSLNKLPNKDLKININLDNLDYKALGIYMDNFVFKTAPLEFNITSSTSQQFEVIHADKLTPTLNFGGNA